MSEKLEAFDQLPPLGEWYPVPYGTVIPEGMPYAVAHDTARQTLGSTIRVEADGASFPIPVTDGYWWTPVIIVPPLPTALGSRILVDIRHGEGPVVLVRVTNGLRGWRLLETDKRYADEDITRWRMLPTTGEWWETVGSPAGKIEED